MSDTSADDKDRLSIVEHNEPSEPVLHIRDTEPILQLFGYDTDSDGEAGLNCSECEERVEAVISETENDLDIGPPTWMNVEGFVCGCSQTPRVWNARSVGTDNNQLGGGDA